MSTRAHARVWSRVGTSIPTYVALLCGRAGPDPCGRSAAAWPCHHRTGILCLLVEGTHDASVFTLLLCSPLRTWTDTRTMSKPAAYVGGVSPYCRMTSE